MKHEQRRTRTSAPRRSDVDGVPAAARPPLEQPDPADGRRVVRVALCVRRVVAAANKVLGEGPAREPIRV